MLRSVRWTITVTLAATFVSVVRAQVENPLGENAPIAQSLIEMERQWAEVCATHDVSVLQRILADDFLGTNTEGKLYTKSEEIEKVRESAKTVSGRLDNVRVRFFGSDVAVLHGVETCVQKTESGEKPETTVWTDTWLKRNGRWQIVAAQDAIYQAKAQEASSTQDDSRVIFVSAKHLDSEIHKAPEVGPGTSFIDLIEYSASRGGVSVTRRTSPGRADVHKRLTDMWYVIRGEGTLVTGGSLSEPTQTETDELRARGITGGEERHIAPGDFVRIPAGVPHWIREIEGKEIFYLAVKVPK